MNEQLPHNLGYFVDKELWHEIIQDEFTLARDQGLPCSIIFIDVNYFKSINDELGHSRGDEVIEGIRHLITNFCNSVRSNSQIKDNDGHRTNEGHSDIIGVNSYGYKVNDDLEPEEISISEILGGRIGGDEIGVFAVCDENGAAKMTERIKKEFDEWLKLSENDDIRKLEIGLAIGRATTNEEISTVGELLRAADEAMYADKQRQRPVPTEGQREALKNILAIMNNQGFRIRDLVHFFTTC